MGYIFDINSARLYESWHNSPHGSTMYRLIEESILTLLDLQPGERILDIGCGAGNHLLLFSKLGLDISGIDASPYMVSRARERLGSRCTLKTGMAEDLPFDDNEFDIAVMIHTLEFLDDPLQALREAGRVARAGVFIGVMNSLSWYYLISKFQGFFCESLFTHGRFYNLWELKSHVEMAFGNVPIAWRSAQIWPRFVFKISGILPGSWNLKYCPLGSFLAMAAKIVYKVKTDNLPLKINLKKTRHSVVNGVTMENLNCEDGIRGDERSLFI